MVSQGGAATLCAREVVVKSRPLAADALEVAADDLVFEGGRYVVAGTDRSIGLLELARRTADEGAHPRDTTTAQAAPRAFPSGAHVAEVEIDPDTGTVELLRYVAFDDCGAVLNAVLLEGQILGGMVQGLGQVLGQQCRYDESGQLHDLSVPAPTNVLGVQGAGEAGTTGALPTAMNAIMDALRPAGVAYLDMPASPQRVWHALQDARAACAARHVPVAVDPVPAMTW